jgi:hypothetical protein
MTVSEILEESKFNLYYVMTCFEHIFLFTFDIPSKFYAWCDSRHRLGAALVVHALELETLEGGTEIHPPKVLYIASLSHQPTCFTYHTAGSVRALAFQEIPGFVGGGDT